MFVFYLGPSGSGLLESLPDTVYHTIHSGVLLQVYSCVCVVD